MVPRLTTAFSGPLLEIERCFLDDNRVSHGEPHFRPACFKMLFCVPGARSSPGLPGTVTRPSLLACLN